MTSEATAERSLPVGEPMSPADIYANARALSGYLREKSAEIDEARRLPAMSWRASARPACSA